MFLTLKRLSGRTGSGDRPLYGDEDREEDRRASEEGDLLPGEPWIGRAAVEEPQVEKGDPSSKHRNPQPVEFRLDRLFDSVRPANSRIVETTPRGRLM